MLDILNFVRGAVATRETALPVLTHFYVQNGHIQGANGNIHIDAVCPDLEFSGVVPAKRFLAAIDVCAEEPKLKVNEEGTALTVTWKKFRARLPLLKAEDFPVATPSKGKTGVIREHLFGTLAALQPFMGTDATTNRRWACSILFHEGYAYATNSAMLARLPCKAFGNETVAIPHYLVDELIRISSDPERYTTDDTSMTLFWEDRWIKGQLIVEPWPVKTVAELLAFNVKPSRLPPGLINAIENLEHFFQDEKTPVVYFNDKGVSTGEGDTGAQIGGFKFETAAFHTKNLLPMLRRSDAMHIIKDDRAFFTGVGDFRGVLISLRVHHAS